jgi:hypothetical protein
MTQTAAPTQIYGHVTDSYSIRLECDSVRWVRCDLKKVSQSNLTCHRVDIGSLLSANKRNTPLDFSEET